MVLALAKILGAEKLGQADDPGSFGGGFANKRNSLCHVLLGERGATHLNQADTGFAVWHLIGQILAENPCAAPNFCEGSGKLFGLISGEEKHGKFEMAHGRWPSQALRAPSPSANGAKSTGGLKGRDRAMSIASIKSIASIEWTMD
jgi:hypothetical protein